MIKDYRSGCFVFRFIVHIHQAVPFEETIAPLIVAVKSSP